MPSPSILCIQIAGARRWRRSARRRSDQARGKETNEKIVLTLFGRSRAAVSAVSGVTGRVQINVGRWLSTAGRQQRRCSGSGGGGGGGPAAVFGGGRSRRAVLVGSFCCLWCCLGLQPRVVRWCLRGEWRQNRKKKKPKEAQTFKQSIFRIAIKLESRGDVSSACVRNLYHIVDYSILSIVLCS